MKSDGLPTYLLADIAYHRKKLARGFDELCDIWGADHHGHIARMQAALKAFGFDPAVLRVILIQIVSLLRNGQPVAMGKREGEFVTLDEVIERGGPRRDPVLLPDAPARHAAGVRPGAGQEAVDGQPGLLRPVRARALRGDPAPGRRAGAPSGPRSRRSWRASWRCPRRSRSCGGWPTSPTSSPTPPRRASRTG